jgi:hypothetical protein|tara:strand:- start:176 stop:412 length:237 start_codon:yes stop_codon:yes gene_type:complete
MVTELVVALLMIVQGEITEHRIQIDSETGKPSMSVCLKGKRIASRNVGSSVEYQCIKSMAEIEVDKFGAKHINKLILK